MTLIKKLSLVCPHFHFRGQFESDPLIQYWWKNILPGAIALYYLSKLFSWDRTHLSQHPFHFPEQCEKSSFKIQISYFAKLTSSTVIQQRSKFWDTLEDTGSEIWIVMSLTNLSDYEVFLKQLTWCMKNIFNWSV